MDWLTQVVWHNGKLFGIDWSVWKIIGWCGNAAFFSRFFVQWYATEKKKRVVVPTAFWWLSLAGSLLLLLYAIFGQVERHKRSWVFIARQTTNIHPTGSACNAPGRRALTSDKW